jgi:signal transduction histidine kinase/ActR/RegA family two-component response regulator
LIVGNEFGQHPGSALAAPLSVMGRIVGTIEVFSLETDSYTNEHETAMRMAANLAAVAIENVQLLDRESRARALAEESNRLKDEFLATVSHELRTPLTAILGWSRMLIMGGFDEQTIIKALETIERNAAAQAQIIDDILDVSRAITGKIALEIAPTDVTRLVESAIDSVKVAADAKGIDIEKHIRCAGCVVSGDANRLQQVIWNLLSNAVKFTPSGGRIGINLEKNGYELIFSVADNGEGMSKEFLPYAFDRFRQADSSYTRTHGGLGLGLAIVKHLVELHGGTVMAESSGPGLGSRFTVRLPLVTRDEAQHPVAVHPNVSVSNGNLAGLNVLVVDDDPDTVEMLKAVLMRDGAAVSTAYSVQEALTSLSLSRPDVIISDLGMPDADGYELAHRVRSMQTATGGLIPMIALTAYAHDEAREESLQRGFMEHLAKPVDPDILKSKIAAIARPQTI